MKQSCVVWLLAGMGVLGGAAHAADMPEREVGLLLGGGWADKSLVGGKDGVRKIAVSLTGGARAEVEADGLAVSGGWNPAVGLTSYHRGRPKWRVRNRQNSRISAT